MFSQACVKNSVHSGGGACVAGGSCMDGGWGCVWHGAYVAGGYAWQGACMTGGVHGRGCARQKGACMAGSMYDRGCAWQRVGACMAGEKTTAADGTHPTGMHSCFFTNLLFIILRVMFSYLYCLLLTYLCCLVEKVHNILMASC